MMLLESGLKAADSFPAGLKVLVVDDDPTWLKILEKMLKKCSYQVTTCGLAIEALRLLRERKDGFDIVISDVNMPDMDGFKLLEHVGLQMDLPVIMMSVDGETSRVMRGVQHGACDYLLKPIRMKELKNIWQHVLRKRMRDVRDIESHDNLDDDDLHLFRYDLSDGGHFLASSDQTFLRKRKDMDSRKGVKDSTDPSAKRRRVVWSVELHQKFVKAVNQIGFDKVGPKKILDLMNVPLLTRENVASHLQKYRLYLSRLEKENDLKSQFPNDSVGGFGTQNSTTMQQSELVNFPCPDYEPREQSIDAKPYKISPSGINSWPLVEPGSVFTSDIAQVHEAAFSPKVGHDISTGLRESKFSLAALDSSLPSQLNVSRESLNLPSELEYKPHQQLLEMSSVKELNLLSAETCNNITEQPHLIGQLTESFGLTTNSLIHIDCNGLPGFEFEPRNHTSSSESAFGSLPGELGDLFSFRDENFATESMGFEKIDYAFPDLSNEALSFCLYGQPRFNYEYFNDSVEYAVVDQSLFIS